jgi:hypothetical protein
LGPIVNNLQEVVTKLLATVWDAFALNWQHCGTSILQQADFGGDFCNETAFTPDTVAQERSIKYRNAKWSNIRDESERDRDDREPHPDRQTLCRCEATTSAKRSGQPATKPEEGSDKDNSGAERTATNLDLEHQTLCHEATPSVGRAGLEVDAKQRYYWNSDCNGLLLDEGAGYRVHRELSWRREITKADGTTWEPDVSPMEVDATCDPEQGEGHSSDPDTGYAGIASKEEAWSEITSTDL